MPQAMGYSICWNKRIMYLHAHLPQEDFSFYEACQGGMWVHFPVSCGEKITEIWTQRLNQGRMLIVSSLDGIERKSTLTHLGTAQDVPWPGLVHWHAADFTARASASVDRSSAAGQGEPYPFRIFSAWGAELRLRDN